MPYEPFMPKLTNADGETPLPVLKDGWGIGPTCITLNCTRTELNRWAADGRLPPDGEKFFWLGGENKRWGRAWLAETIQKAQPQLAEWRERDRVAAMKKKRTK